MSEKDNRNLDVELDVACEEGDLERVRRLVGEGADIHANDNHALRWASEKGHLEVVKFLEACIKKEKKEEAEDKLEVGYNFDEIEKQVREISEIVKDMHEALNEMQLAINILNNALPEGAGA